MVANVECMRLYGAQRNMAYDIVLYAFINNNKTLQNGYNRRKIIGQFKEKRRT